MRYHVGMRPRRVGEMVEATRWLFAALALASLPLALLAPLAAGNDTMLLVALASSGVLALSWSAGYLRRSAPLTMDVVDALATLSFALACPQPAAAFGFVFFALWFRSLYGSTGRAVLRCGLYVVALSAALPLWPYVPGHTGTAAIGPLVGTFPTMFLSVIAGRKLVGSLRARERAARRDEVHASMGSQLLGITDTDEIRQIAWTAVTGICAATPGLRVLKVVRDGAVLRVDGAGGGFADVPATLPAAVLPARSADGGAGCETAQSTTDLDVAVGTPCAWACVTLPNVPNQPADAWLFLGSPRKIPEAVVAAVDSLANLMTLALRNGKVHEDLTAQATLDNLTGLANRASFTTALSAALADESSPDTSVLYVDLDDFKDVNDVLGHAAGDDLLREVALRLRRTTRPADLCARLGGDEFAILLRGTGGAVAAYVAQRVVQAIADTADNGGGVAHVSASVDVATATSETNLEQLLHRADVAMYAAKSNGKARFQVFEPRLLQGDSAEMVFERQLLAAASNGELIVHFQPVLSLRNKRCIAVEAMVRWQHPDQGLLFPDSFMEAAERIGAIRGIGAYLLRRACAEAAIWRDAHPNFRLAIHINISALQLDDAGFIDSVSRCISDFTMAPDQLVLEVSDTVVISSTGAITQVNALAALGVTIAIDDFGIGSSTLTTLRSLPVQIVKIDSLSLADSTESPEDRAAIETVVRMTAQMGLRTIADGVEKLEQQTFLETIGADAVQGDLYLRPTSAEGFGDWLEKHLRGLTRTPPIDDVVLQFTPRNSA